MPSDAECAGNSPARVSSDVPDRGEVVRPEEHALNALVHAIDETDEPALRVTAVALRIAAPTPASVASAIEHGAPLCA